MKKLILILCVFALISCGEERIHSTEKQLFGFKIEAQKIENGYVTLKVENTTGKGFAYAEYSPTMAIPISANQIRLVFSDTATIKVMSSSNISFFQFKESNDGIILDPDGCCHVGIYFEIYKDI